MKKHPKVQFFQSEAGKWRWRLRASNGRILCTPGEDFSSKAKAEKNYSLVCGALQDSSRERVYL